MRARPRPKRTADRAPERLAHFDVETGPAALFERLRRTLAPKRVLMLSGATLFAPWDVVSTLRQFDALAQPVLRAAVRVDSGLVVVSTWLGVVHGAEWLMEVTPAGGLLRIAPAASSALPGSVLVDGPLYEFVAQVSREAVSQDLFAAAGLTR